MKQARSWAPKKPTACWPPSRSHIRGASWLVCAGSLPAGVPVGWYREVIEMAHSNGVPVAIDTSGDALAQSLSAAPDLVKPNVDELAEVTGRVPQTLGDVIDAAQEVRRRGARTVLASLGSDGAILVDDIGAVWGHAPVDRVVSTVGAGDAMLAGYLSCPHRPRRGAGDRPAMGCRRRSERGNPVPPQHVQSRGDVEHHHRSRKEAELSSTVSVDAFEVADPADAWTRAGFSVDSDDVCRIGGVRIRLVGRSDTGTGTRTASSGGRCAACRRTRRLITSTAFRRRGRTR